MWIWTADQLVFYLFLCWLLLNQFFNLVLCLWNTQLLKNCPEDRIQSLIRLHLKSVGWSSSEQKFITESSGITKKALILSKILSS